eukprot:349400_1
MLSVVLALIVNIINHSSAYYLSLSEFKWLNASNYCQNHCHSQLASIHSEEDYQNIKQLLEYYKPYIVQDISIGLNNISGQGFDWSDGSVFDYANGTVGSYPWRSNRPHGQLVVVLNKDTLEFQDVGSAGRRHFLCNHCDGVITKYIIPNMVTTRYNESQQYCRNTFGTTLASLHSDIDMREAQLICEERTNSNGCWIGIQDDGNFNFKQDDGTSFDYGNQLNGNGVYPWSTGQPINLQNNMDIHCVILASNEDYLWNGNTSCVQYAPKPICNIPSEICYSDEWQVIYGQNDWNFNSPPCELSHSATVNNNLIKLYRKQWSLSYGTKLIIEFIFSIVNSASFSACGLYLFTSTSQDYFIGIETDNNIFLRATEHPGNDANYLININASLDSAYSFGTYYMLKIEILDNKMTVFFNNTEHLRYEQMSTNQNISIGIKHMMSSINIKSLYVSGTPYFNYNATTTLFPTLSPTTVVPTNTPTVPTIPICNRGLLLCPSGGSVARDPYNNCEWFPCPTGSPTISPTIFECSEDKSAVITISFDYTLQNDASETQIENVLINVTNNLFEKEIQILSNCNITDYYSEIESIEDNKAVIKVSICYICNDKIILNVPAIQNNLTTDFIQAIDDHATNLLAILPGSTTVIVNEKEIYGITTTVMAGIIKSNPQEANTFWPIMVTLFVLLCVCIIIFVVYVVKKRSDGGKDDTHDGIALSITDNPGVKTSDQNIIIRNEQSSGIDDISMHDDADIVGDVNTITAGNDVDNFEVNDDIDILMDGDEEVTRGSINTGEIYEQRTRGYTPVAINYAPNQIEKLQNKDNIILELEEKNEKNAYENEFIIEDDLPTNDGNTVRDEDMVVMGNDEEINTNGNL